MSFTRKDAEQEVCRILVAKAEVELEKARYEAAAAKALLEESESKARTQHIIEAMVKQHQASIELPRVKIGGAS